MIDSGRYYAAVTTDDVWICYPWEAEYVRADTRYIHGLNAD